MKKWLTHLLAQRQSCQTAAHLRAFNIGVIDLLFAQRQSCQASAHQHVSNKGMIDSPIGSKTVLSNCCPTMRFQHRSDQLTYLLKDSPVEHLPIHRVLLYLPVAGVHYIAVLAAQNETAAVRDGVSHPQWRAPEASKAPGMLPAVYTHGYITFLVFKTHEGSRQTTTVSILRMSDLNDTIHSMLF